MGRKRKLKNKGLPKGVYQSGNRSYETKYWGGERLISTGSYMTVEEAEYMSHLIRYGHHWKGLDRGDNWGFVYLITNRKTGKKYVGKKQFLLWNGPRAGYKCTDLKDEWFDADAWKPNDWKTYIGSQDDLKAELKDANVWDYTFEVLTMAVNVLDLHLAEVHYQMKWDVLEAVDDDGEYLFYNKNIAGQVYRAPFRKSNLLAVQAKDTEAMRNYYLKPQLDGQGNVIPYGKQPVTRRFKDVTAQCSL